MLTKESIEESLEEVDEELQVLQQRKDHLEGLLTSFENRPRKKAANGKRGTGKSVAQHADDIVDWLETEVEAYTGSGIAKALGIPNSSARAAVKLLDKERPRRVEVVSRKPLTIEAK